MWNYVKITELPMVYGGGCCKKIDVLMDGGKCLTGGELLRDFRASNIWGAYQFRYEITWARGAGAALPIS